MFIFRNYEDEVRRIRYVFENMQKVAMLYFEAKKDENKHLWHWMEVIVDNYRALYQSFDPDFDIFDIRFPHEFPMVRYYYDKRKNPVPIGPPAYSPVRV